MSEISILLRTGKFSGDMHQPGVGISKLEFDVVKGIRFPNRAALNFNHFSLPNQGDSTTALTLPEDVVNRIYSFSEDHFVNGKGSFDCRSFLGYVAGWDTEAATGVVRAYHGNYVRAADTKNGLPYLVSQRDGGATPHAVIGIDQPGMSLGVAGYEQPLVIANNADLLRVFGGFALLEVKHIENL